MNAPEPTGAAGAATDPTALAPLRVLELAGGDAAAYAARVLGDFGAKVTTLRVGEAPAPASKADALLHAFLSWNKVTRTVSTGTSGAELIQLAKEFDIVVLGDDLGAIEAWPVSPQNLHEQLPDTTVVTITPFGLTGPMAHWPASELVLQAMSGVMAFSGTQSRTPLKRGLRQSVYATGLNAAYAALASYYGVLVGQRAALIDLSQREVLTSELVLNLPYYSHIGAVQGRLPESRDMFFTGSPIEASDGMVSMQINNRIGVDAYAELLDEPALADERFSTNEGRLANADEITELAETALKKWQCRDFFERAADGGLLTGFVQTAANLLDCPQLTAREFWTEVEIDGEQYRLPGRLASLSATPLTTDQVELQQERKENSHA